MIQTINITGIKQLTTNKDGVEYKDKQVRVVISASNLPDGKKETSCFASPGSPVLKWTAGEAHEVDLSYSADGKFLNFAVTKRDVYPNPNVTARPVQTNTQATGSGTLTSPAAVQTHSEEILHLLKENTKTLEAIKTYLTGEPK